MDYEGGGTYFECLDATVHIQRGHALCFPGKLRHCGQRITSGLRFLLVAFLVDKSTAPPANANGGNGGTGSSSSSSQKELTACNSSTAGDKSCGTTAGGVKSIVNANKRENEDEEDDLAYRTA